MAVICYKDNPFYLGYTATQRLPVGYTVSKGLSIFEGKQFLNTYFHHRFSPHTKNHDIQIQTAVSNLFFINKLKDYIDLNFRQRQFAANQHKFSNIQLLYGLGKNDMQAGLGVDYLNVDKLQKVGARFYYAYWGWDHLDFYGRGSVFSKNIDYQLGISKYLGFNRNFMKGLSIGLFYERFRHGNEVGIDLKLSFM